MNAQSMAPGAWLGPKPTDEMRSLMTPQPYMMWIYFLDLRPCISCGVPSRRQVLVGPDRGVCEECWG